MPQIGHLRLEDLLTRLHALEYVSEAQVKAGIIPICVLALEEVLVKQ